MDQQLQISQAIEHLETRRDLLGDAVVDASIAALREKLAALTAAPRDEQRKLVTVLCADLAGWTAMSEPMDAEDLRSIQQAYFAAVTPPIIERGGRVEKYIGDAVLAVFGVPQAREDDPEQAVRAALAMQQALSTLHAVETLHATSLRHATSHATSLRTTSHATSLRATSLRMRIGVHTGPVLATVGQHSDDFVITGDTVNLAARLQRAAPPGGVLISHDTWRHVQGLFNVEPQQPLMVKGKAEPVQTYRVEAARPRLFRRETRGVAGIETRMIGRDAELLTLQNTLQDMMADGELRLVTVVGEGGVGKSRLLSEFEQWVADIPETVWYFKGRASPDSERQPYGLLRTMLASRFGIIESDTLAEVRRKLQNGIASAHPEGETLGQGAALEQGVRESSTHLIGHLIGYDFSDSPHLKPLLDDPQQLRAQALTALASVFEALAAQGPVLMLLEDLHWADSSSLDALNHLAQLLKERPLFVLGAARPELYERWPYWGVSWVLHSRLDLRPLSKRVSRQLVAEILQRVDHVPESLLDLIVDGADGNPFFVEELVKMLVDDGVIDASSQRWRVDLAKLRQDQIPATLTGVLQARLDRLPDEERTTLQQAAVVGPVFWDLAVLACSGDLVSQDAERIRALRATLQNLGSRELIHRRETSAFDSATEHIFNHAILRDVTYETVLRRLRRVYHGLVADWLIAQAGERVGEFLGTIADHLEGAERDNEAVSYLLRAGDRARLVAAHGEAVVRYQRALALLEAKGDYDQAARTCMRLGITHQNAFDYASARLAFDQGFALRQRVEDISRAGAVPPAPHALRVDWAEPNTLDPTLCEDIDSGNVIGNLFSGLAELDDDFGVTPDVARSWQISEDGCTYVVQLRDDVHWSDGAPVTAGDFVYAWRRRLDPGRSTTVAAILFDVKNARAYHRGEMTDARQLGMQAIDEKTLVVELKEPVGYFTQLLAHYTTFPVPRHVVESWGDRWTDADNIATNGPFLVASWQPGQLLILERNPRYHGWFGGNVAQIRANFLADWFVKLAMYEADELDVLYAAFRSNATPMDWMRARQRHTDEYTTASGWGCRYVGLNTSKQPFDDPRVRRALVLATSREAYTDTLFQGHVVPATGGFVPPGIPGHSPDIGLPYDPALARQLLAEAGYPGGRGFPIIEALGSEWNAKELAFLAQQWSDQLGIMVMWAELDERAFYEQINSSTGHAFMAGWTADYPDPDDFLRVAMMHGQVSSSWNNETFARLVRQARQVRDPQARLQLYRQADRILIQEAVIMPLFYGQGHWLRKPWLTVLLRDKYAALKDMIIRPH